MLKQKHFANIWILSIFYSTRRIPVRTIVKTWPEKAGERCVVFPDYTDYILPGSDLCCIISAVKNPMLHINFRQLIGRFIPFYGIADGHLLSSSAHPFSFDKNPFPEILHIKYGFLFSDPMPQKYFQTAYPQRIFIHITDKKIRRGSCAQTGLQYPKLLFWYSSSWITASDSKAHSIFFVTISHPGLIQHMALHLIDAPRPHRISPISILLVNFFDR